MDGIVNIQDVQTLITDIVRTENGDFDLDREIDGFDFLALQIGAGTVSSGLYSQGDADLNGAINGIDLSVWEAAYGTHGIVSPVAAAAAVPEPRTLGLFLVGMTFFAAALRVPGMFQP